jgi:hypothetical protein
MKNFPIYTKNLIFATLIVDRQIRIGNQNEEFKK